MQKWREAPSPRRQGGARCSLCSRDKGRWCGEGTRWRGWGLWGTDVVPEQAENARIARGATHEETHGHVETPEGREESILGVSVLRGFRQKTRSK